jgi:hypothetical protein
MMKTDHLSWDVLFDEGGQWNWEQIEVDADRGSENFSLEYLVLSSRCTRDTEEQIAMGTPATSPAVMG